MNGKSVLMHRMIMKAPKELLIDHRDRNPLNNTKENLRFCNPHESKLNTKRKYNKQSGKFKGVFEHEGKTGKVYNMMIETRDGRIQHVFTDEIAAANAYNYYAKQYFKEFAFFNEVDFMEKEEWEKFISIMKRAKIVSKYRGVGWHIASEKWRAYIGKDNKHYDLGYFDKEDDAARTYNKKALEFYGEDAKINIIPGCD